MIAAALSLVVASLLAWLTGIAVNINRYHRFRLARAGNKLQREHGLVTLQENTLPLERVQVYTFRTNPLMRRYRWWALDVQTMAVDPSSRGRSVVVPFARWHEVQQIANRLEAVEIPATFSSVSKHMIRRRFLRYGGILLLLALLASQLWRPALWMAAALPITLLVAILQYRNHGFALTDSYLYIRSGLLRHQISVIPRRKFQVFFSTASIFQRRLGLENVWVDTAGAPTLGYPRIVDLPRPTARALFTALHREFLTTPSKPSRF